MFTKERRIPLQYKVVEDNTEILLAMLDSVD